MNLIRLMYIAVLYRFIFIPLKQLKTGSNPWPTAIYRKTALLGGFFWRLGALLTSA